jgi:hypothetical protein
MQKEQAMRHWHYVQCALNPAVASSSGVVALLLLLLLLQVSQMLRLLL